MIPSPMSRACRDSCGAGSMTERNDLELALLAEGRRLAELRALRERVAQRRLEDNDWAVVSALAAAAIEEAEPGQEWVTIGFSEEDEALDEEALVRRAGGAVAVEDSTPEHPRR